MLLEALLELERNVKIFHIGNNRSDTVANPGLRGDQRFGVCSRLEATADKPFRALAQLLDRVRIINGCTLGVVVEILLRDADTVTDELREGPERLVRELAVLCTYPCGELDAGLALVVLARLEGHLVYHGLHGGDKVALAHALVAVGQNSKADDHIRVAELRCRGGHVLAHEGHRAQPPTAGHPGVLAQGGRQLLRVQKPVPVAQTVAQEPVTVTVAVAVAVTVAVAVAVTVAVSQSLLQCRSHHRSRGFAEYEFHP
eukprot:688387-Prorocentrum_minimum.AAC.4